jgi:hypothetical protein
MPRGAALEVEDRHGGLESLLVSAVQFGKSKPTSGNSESLSEVTLQKAEGAAQKLQPREIVPFKALWVPLQVAVGLAGVIVLFAFLNGPFLSVGLTRIFTPWVEVAYPTDTKLHLKEEYLVVKEGDRTKIEIGVSGVIPGKANLYLRTGAGSERKLEIEITDGGCEYTLASASRDFSYRIKAGDARSDWHEVRVINGAADRERAGRGRISHLPRTRGRVGRSLDPDCSTKHSSPLGSYSRHYGSARQRSIVTAKSRFRSR